MWPSERRFSLFEVEDAFCSFSWMEGEVAFLCLDRPGHSADVLIGLRDSRCLCFLLIAVCTDMGEVWRRSSTRKSAEVVQLPSAVQRS